MDSMEKKYGKIGIPSVMGHLKVVGNEKNGGSGRSQMLRYGAGPGRSMFIYNLNMQF